MEHNYINEKIIYFNNNYNFEKALSVPLILNQIFKFLGKDSIKCLSLCNKKIYQLYCNQVKELRINKEADISNLLVLIDKYDNANIVNLSECKNIEDFTPLSKIERLEILNVSETNISDISFLDKNKNIKELNLYNCKNIIDFTPISKIEKLEILDVGSTIISDISFLEKIKILKN